MMKTIIPFLLSMMVASQSFGMGRVFQESLDNPPGDPAAPGEFRQLEPTPEAAAAVDTIDRAGDAAGAFGVPFASVAGEVASGILGLALLIMNQKRREESKAARSIVKAVEINAPPEIKASIQKQAIKDGTISTVHRNVKAVT